ncbi:MAG TPA: tetratricopeptide repeat protein [Acidobacteriaceae bacterium]|jgi:tetratricopeptide (TPR) repeat protein|nr:tetratricopeptide repeat protein [Acidobacteriaceae bacterium]
MLRRVAIFGTACGCGLLLALPAMARQQDNAPPPQQNQPATGSNQNSNSKKDEKKPSKDAQNAFPEAQSQAAAKQSQQQQQQEQNDGAPAAPAPQSKPKSTAAQNPFPEEQSEKAARQEQENTSSAPPTTGKGDFSSSQVKGMDLPDTETAPTTETPGPMAYNPKLAKKDVQVGTFYLQTGDSKGAYDRFEEAVHSDPDNAEAVFGLGESAMRVGKRDEAMRNYSLYLSALPDGPHAKEARKAMKQMGAQPPA